MGFCVFMHRSDSIYDDRPDEQYQFPKQYLGRAEQAVGSWIVYLEPKKAWRSRGYFAVARLQQIVADPSVEGMFLAIIEPNSYLEFPNSVPFSDDDGLTELGLLNNSGKISGRAQAAVRPISPEDFNRIVARGISDQDLLLPRDGDVVSIGGFAEEQLPYSAEEPRSRVEQLTKRIIRDRVFRRIVLQAYDERCAITGLKLINGGGRAEVNAAHIRPVEKNGPDIVQNGIALSGTVHWMFDRGLLGLGDDLRILISRHVNDQEGIRNFVNKSGYAFTPQNSRNRPHPTFLHWHRENCFKG
ncbi:MAG: HNH endonuclease [Beijerinckiaceae bacterium]